VTVTVESGKLSGWKLVPRVSLGRASPHLRPYPLTRTLIHTHSYPFTPSPLVPNTRGEYLQIIDAHRTHYFLLNGIIAYKLQERLTSLVPPSSLSTDCDHLHTWCAATLVSCHFPLCRWCRLCQWTFSLPQLGRHAKLHFVA